jgi:hypothetical protein
MLYAQLEEESETHYTLTFQQHHISTLTMIVSSKIHRGNQFRPILSRKLSVVFHSSPAISGSCAFSEGFATPP